MVANPIWIAAYGGPPPTAIGAAPVWIAPNDGSVPSAVASQVVGYGGPVAGASPVWIAAYGGPPPAAIGATPITLAGYGSGGSGGGGATSVWSASDAAANGMTLSNGGLTVTGLAGNKSIRNSISKTTGKLYVEFLVNVASGGSEVFGLGSTGFNVGSYLGSSVYSGGTQPGTNSNYVSSGFVSNYNPGSVAPLANDVFALAVDFGSGNVWTARNNVWSNSSNPATGSLPIMTFTPSTVGALFAALGSNISSGTYTLQSTPASQKYAPPSGFSAWG